MLPRQLIFEDGQETFRRPSGGYEGARPDIQALIPTGVTSVLDLGCSSGALGSALKAGSRVHVIGVELHPECAAEAAKKLDRVVCADVENFVLDPPDDLGPIDCLVAADVLEHLVSPWTTLLAASRLISPGGWVVVSVPNVLYWRAMRRLIFGGRWPLDDSGIFDRTHLRWFTVPDAVSLLEQAGLVDVCAHPKLWDEGWALKIIDRLKWSPLDRFFPAQTLLTGRTPMSNSTGVR